MDTRFLSVRLSASLLALATVAFTFSITNTEAAVAAKATIDPSSVDFGNVTVGSSSAAEVVTLKNTGITRLRVSNVTLSGSNLDQFEMVDNGCKGSTLTAGQSCTVDVSFTPTSEGAKNADLTFSDNAGTQTVPLSGTGQAVPDTSLPVGYSYFFENVDGDVDTDAISFDPESGDVQVSRPHYVEEDSCQKFNNAEDWGSLPTGYDYYFADIDGDKDADAIGINAGAGSVIISRSTGSSFNTPYDAGKVPSGYEYDVGNINGDTAEDLVALNPQTGEVQIFVSTGTQPAFNQYNGGVLLVGYNYSLADVNGNGAVDAIGLNAENGDVQVSYSRGFYFEAPVDWGTLSTGREYLFSDVHGNELADAIGVASNTGNVQVSNSSSTYFESATDWGTLLSGYNYDAADINGGNQKSDMVMSDPETGEVWLSFSTGTYFTDPCSMTS